MIKKLIFSAIAFIIITSACLAETDQLTQAKYPNIDISGSKRYIYGSLNVDQIPAVWKLPYDYVSGEGNFKESLQLGIYGDLTRDLSVYYDLEQFPNRGDTLLTAVSYQGNDLIIGNFNQFYRSDYLFQDGFSGVIFAKSFWGFKPFVGTTGIYYSPSADDDNVHGTQFIYRDTTYYGSDAFPVSRNYYNRFDREFWMNKQKYAYKFFPTGRTAKDMSIDALNGRLYLLNSDVFFGSEQLYVDGQRRFKGFDYDISYNNGEVLFKEPVPAVSEFKADYFKNYSEKQYNANPAGINWNIGDGHDLTIGYLSGVNRDHPGNNFSISNLKYDCSNGDTTFSGEYNISDYDDGTIKDSGNATVLSLGTKMFGLKYFIGYSGMSNGFASSSLIMSGVKDHYEQRSAYFIYDIPSSDALEGHIKYGLNETSNGTKEAIVTDDLNSARIIEADNKLLGWLGQTNRYQDILSRPAGTSDRVRTYSFLNISSIDLSHFYPMLGRSSKVFLKNLSERAGYGNIGESSTMVEIGKLVEVGPYSILLSKNMKDSTAMYMTTEATTYGRLGWDTQLMSVPLKVYLESTEINGASANDYTMNLNGIGFVINVPQSENMILVNINIGLGFRTVIYHDHDDPSNDYVGRELRYNAEFDF